MQFEATVDGLNSGLFIQTFWSVNKTPLSLGFVLYSTVWFYNIVHWVIFIGHILKLAESCLQSMVWPNILYFIGNPMTSFSRRSIHGSGRVPSTCHIPAVVVNHRNYPATDLSSTTYRYYMTLYIGQQHPITVYRTGICVCVALVLSVIRCSSYYFLDRIIFHHDFHQDIYDYHWDFYGH